jgi:excisionase family DNA binding protein
MREQLEVVAAVERSTLTVVEAATYLGISKNLMYQLVREKQIPAIRLGRRILFKIDSIDRWLVKKEEEGA